MGRRIPPGMLTMLGEQFDSVIFPLIELLYRLPGEQRPEIGGLMSSLGVASHPATSMARIFIIESMARLMKILADFGAADVDWGTSNWRSDHAAPHGALHRQLPCRARLPDTADAAGPMRHPGPSW